MGNPIWQIEQSHLTDISGRLHNQIEITTKQLANLKTELISNRTSISDDFCDISGKRALDFSQVLPMLQMREREYLNLSEVLAKLELLNKSPYFGSIEILLDEEEKEKLYIGLSTFRDEQSGDILIYDWRAPVSSLFYENQLGPSRYQIPDGEYMSVEIAGRRQYKVAYDKLLQVLDADLYIGDEVLQSLLTDTAKDKMKSIVATIQSDQNAVIRSSNLSNLIVLGPPGSGKTSVAMQRIAFLLYKYSQTMSARNILLISPSDLFNDYISNVLPELGEENVQHTTYYSLFKDMKLHGIIAETNYENIERLQKADSFSREGYAFKGSQKYANQLFAYLHNLKTAGMPFYKLKMGNQIFISATELKQLFYDKFAGLDIDFRLKKIRSVLLKRLESWKQQSVNKRLKELKEVNKYIGTDHELEQRAKGETEKRFNSLSKVITTIGFVNIHRMYIESLVYQNEQAIAVEIQKDTSVRLKQEKLYYEDLAPLMYLHTVIKGIYANNDIKHIVIDEIQDYSYLQLLVIQSLHPKAHYTLLGDKNQLVHPALKDSLSSALTEQFLTIELNKSYRSTQEITTYMSAILDNHDTLSLGVTGEKPTIIEVTSQGTVIQQLISSHFKSNDSFAILCKDKQASQLLYAELKPYVEELRLVTEEQKLFMKGIVIMPGYMAKGFEFTTVVLADADEKLYGEEMDAYLLYTMTSRATRQLFVLYQDHLASTLKQINSELYKVL